MTRAGLRDVLLAGLLLGLGATSLWAASPLTTGEISRMGPGFLPQTISVALLALGSFVAARAGIALFRGLREAANEPIPWRGLFYVSAAILTFALLVRPGGLLLASSLAVLLCASAEISSRWRERFLLAGGFAVAAALIFVVGLGLPLSLYPALS